MVNQVVIIRTVTGESGAAVVIKSVMMENKLLSSIVLFYITSRALRGLVL